MWLRVWNDKGWQETLPLLPEPAGAKPNLRQVLDSWYGTAAKCIQKYGFRRNVCVYHRDRKVDMALHHDVAYQTGTNTDRTRMRAERLRAATEVSLARASAPLACLAALLLFSRSLVTAAARPLATLSACPPGRPRTSGWTHFSAAAAPLTSIAEACSP